MNTYTISRGELLDLGDWYDNQGEMGGCQAVLGGDKRRAAFLRQLMRVRQGLRERGFIDTTGNVVREDFVQRLKNPPKRRKPRRLHRKRVAPRTHSPFATMERLLARGGKTVAKLACEMGCCTSTVKRVRSLVRHASPETLQQLRAGRISIGSAWDEQQRLRRA